MFAKKLREIRLKKKLSLRELAQEASLPHTTIVKLEQGISKEPTIQTMIKLADALNVSVDELVGRKRRNWKQR